jgi:low affinity Fe/Cu permease
LAWLAIQPHTFDWHAVATVATLYIALFIQRATHRDTQALHAKVDELIHVNSRARNTLTSVDNEEPEDIERHQTPPAKP